MVAELKKNVNFASLVDWMEGRLSEHEARAVEETLARADDDTLADAAWLRKFFEAADSIPIESPPQKVRHVLVDAFEANARAQRPSGFVELMFGKLAFDSNLQPAAGLRAVGSRQSRRQLIFHADTFDLAINLLARSSDGDLDLDGQMLANEGAEPELFSVQLLRDGTEQGLAAVDEFGSFAIQRIPPGNYELVFSADQIEIMIAPLEVGL
jgi:hypothetical protein